jgi:predicted amidohydrolase YtcJ
MGSIEVGKLANMSVLAEDPFMIDAHQLGSISIDAVLFEGNVVHGAL